jgi:hypothetical protein
MNSKRSSVLRNCLVVAEVAATFVLSVGAGLLLHTMMALTARNMGYDTRQLLVVDADVPSHADVDYRRAVQQYNEMFTRLTAIPGVEHSAGIMGLPTGDYGSNGYYETPGGRATSIEDKPWALFSVASPGYFRTMEIPIRRGRDFASQNTDKSAFVAIISESLARQGFGNIDPVGKQIRCGLDTDKWMTLLAWSAMCGRVLRQTSQDQRFTCRWRKILTMPTRFMWCCARECGRCRSCRR